MKFTIENVERKLKIGMAHFIRINSLLRIKGALFFLASKLN